MLLSIDAVHAVIQDYVNTKSLLSLQRQHRLHRQHTQEHSRVKVVLKIGRDFALPWPKDSTMIATHAPAFAQVSDLRSTFCSGQGKPDLGRV